MKIMLIEDDSKKRREIKSYLNEKGISDEAIILVKNMTDFSANLQEDIGLFIIDFKLPCIDDSAPSQNGKAIIESIVKAGKNDALLLAISAYPDDFPELRSLYEAQGCILADFKHKKIWKSILDHLIIQLNKTKKLDFLVFCALQEERNPYITLLKGKSVIRNGVDCFDVKIAGKNGAIILIPKMGLVNAAITASICIDRFKPAVVGMSGICGGIEGRAELGQLILSNMVYEYQSGKWASDGFKQEPYQVSTDHITLTKMKSLMSDENLICELEKGFSGTRPSRSQKLKDGIFTSGSAVIADTKYIKQVESIHRKVNALDMEIFAIQRAAELSPYKPPCICAKTVVDLCNENKSDDIHQYGCYVSAKFLIKAIENFFSH